jgi:hypothetical protein
MDAFDRASENETRERDASIARHRVYQPLPDIGACYNCGEELRVGQRFCDADCRNDYEKLQKGRRDGTG